MKGELLRFTTAGSVDDGKSTLIGRLLYDSKMIFEDHMAAIKSDSKKFNTTDGEFDLALLVDGLQSEREQGITIDVSHLYFSTPKRRFIIADAPGHVEYTRNMVTGASTSQASIILIDARKGVIEQTNRHFFINNLLRIKDVVVAINKMDLVDYSEDVYNKIKADFSELMSKRDYQDQKITFIPVSALKGDNVVNKSENMPWYQGAPMLHTLETMHIGSDINKIDTRFPVQTVLRPQREGFIDYRGYAGRLASGILRKGDEVTVLPSGFTSTIKSINNYDNDITEAISDMSISMTLEDEYDVSRGDMIVKPNNLPVKDQRLSAMICWFNENPARPRAKYILKHTSNEPMAMINEIEYKVDVNTLHRIIDDKDIKMNDICKV